MPYDSPTTLRRRQQRQTEAPRRPRQRRANKTFTDAVWTEACDFHIAGIREQVEQGHAEAAGRHAEALTHMAVTRRTLEILRALNSRDLWGAMAMAKTELFDGEVA